MRLKNEISYQTWGMYLVASLLLLGVDALGWSSGLRTLSDRLLNPTTKLVRNASLGLSKPLKMAQFISTGPNRILDLETRYAEAMVSLEELDDLRQENESLKKILGHNPDEDLHFQATSVVGGSDEIVISSGTASGVKPGDTVVDDANTLLGIVSRSSAYTSWVITPRYHSSRIPVTIGPDKVSGYLVSSQNQLFVEVEQADTVAVGDRVITSGINGEYVPNILVGKVTFVEEETANIYKKVEVDLLSNTSNTVFIVKEDK